MKTGILGTIMDNDAFIALLLITIYIVFAVWTLPTTGITVDENRYIAQGKARAYSLYSMATGKPDLFFCDITNDFGAFDTSNELASRCWEGRPKLPITLSGITWAGIWFINGGTLDVMASISAHRLAIILLTAIGLLGVFLFIRESHGFRAAAFSILAITFMPRFFAHSKYVLMDESVAIFWLLTIWLFWKGLKNWKYGIFSGVMMGLALATKAQSIFIPLVIAAWLLLSYRDKLKVKIGGLMKRKVPKCFITFASFIVITPIVWFLSWPWIWYDTARRFFLWTGYYLNHISGGLPPVYFLGEIVLKPSWIYIFSLAASTIPVPIMIASVAGAYFAARHTIKLTNRVSLLILLSALAPMVVLSVINTAYNGVQQFIQSFLFIGILAGIGADELLKSKNMPSRIRDKMKAVTIIVSLLFIIPGAVSIFNGHTDTYFNSLVGGAGGVYNAGIFETEWSGEAYLQTAYWLNENAVQNASLYVPIAYNVMNTYKYGDIGQITERLNVTSGSLNGFNFEQDTILRNDIDIIGYYDMKNDPSNAENTDYVVLMSRFGLFGGEYYYNSLSRSCVENNEPVYSVMSYGAPLVRVYRTPCQ